MGLSQLEITNIRNLHPAKLELAQGFNGLYGANGSGKTSILEALYILGRGASFRTPNLERALQAGKQYFNVIGKQAPANVALGVEYQAQGLHYRIGGQEVGSRLELLSHLPLVFINPESHALISEGPKLRRRYMDWGVFHVEPRFIQEWRRFQRALKQRNAALGTPKMDGIWDAELVRAAQEITQMRRAYLVRLIPYVQHYVASLVDLAGTSLGFVCGWRQDSEYLDALRASLTHDREYGYTRQGPHRADLVIKVDNQLARDVVSRGQQKLLVSALLLAQAALLAQETQRPPLVLVDDLAAELDEEHRKRLVDALSEIKAQVVLTATEKDIIPIAPNDIKWFHVEQGVVTPS